MIKHRHSGGRMQNYYPRAVRYTVAGGEFYDPQWGARLAGILFLVMGGVLLITPLVKWLGVGSQIFFGIFGVAPFMTRTPSVPVAIAAAAVLILVGVGVVARFGPAFFVAMVLTFFMFMPAFPVGSAVGCVLLFVLWQGLPTREPVEPPASPSEEAAARADR